MPTGARSPRFPSRWSAPKFPINAGAFFARGLPPGPQVGAALQQAEALWIERGFTDDPLSLVQVIRDAMEPQRFLSSACGCGAATRSPTAATITSTALVSPRQHDGLQMRGNRHQQRQQHQPDDVRQREVSRHRPFEQPDPGEIERRPADHRGDRRRLQMADRMGEHQFVGHRAHHDAGDHQQMRIGIGLPRQLSGIV